MMTVKDNWTWVLAHVQRLQSGSLPMGMIKLASRSLTNSQVYGIRFLHHKFYIILDIKLIDHFFVDWEVPSDLGDPKKCHTFRGSVFFLPRLDSIFTSSVGTWGPSQCGKRPAVTWRRYNSDTKSKTPTKGRIWSMAEYLWKCLL